LAWVLSSVVRNLIAAVTMRQVVVSVQDLLSSDHTLRLLTLSLKVLSRVAVRAGMRECSNYGMREVDMDGVGERRVKSEGAI